LSGCSRPRRKTALIFYLEASRVNEVLETVNLKPESVIMKHVGRKQDSTRPVARFLGRLIFFSLLVTIALTAIPYGTVQPWWIAIFECVVFVIAILGAIETSTGKSWSTNDLSLFAPLLFLTLFVVFQSLPLFSGIGPLGLGASLSADPYGTRQFAIRLFALIVAALLLLRYTASKARLRNLIYVIIAVGVASAFFGIMRKNLQQGPGFFLPGLTIVDRSFGQFVNRNHFAFLMEMCLGLTLGLIAGEIGRYRRVLVLLSVSALLWVALIYSNSRGGILASLCELLFLGFMLDPISHLTRAPVGTRWRRFQNLASGLAVRAFLGGCLIALFAYGVGWVGGEPVVFNFQQATTDFSQQEMENNVNTSRKEIWSATWQLIKAHPVAGVGFGGYWVSITRYHNASGAMTPQQAHNDYLELLASGGAIGCALVAWFAVVFLRRARQRLNSPDPYYRAACLGALTGLFGVAVHSFVDFGIHVTINSLVSCALIVIAVQSGLVREPDPRAGLPAGIGPVGP
jgi:O-antigen ligase